MNCALCIVTCFSLGVANYALCIVTCFSLGVANCALCIVHYALCIVNCALPKGCIDPYYRS